MRLRDALNCIARLNFGGGMDADWKMRHGRLLAIPGPSPIRRYWNPDCGGRMPRVIQLFEWQFKSWIPDRGFASSGMTIREFAA